jgi:ubiquinone/menaquinone biosynthesis C-methylase UbiE
MNRRFFFKFYSKLQRVIVPGLRSSQYTYRDTLVRYLDAKTRWLDMGCGHNVLADWMTHEEADLALARYQIFGLDMDAGSLRLHRGIRHKVLGDGERTPFREGSFGMVTANMVVEHIQDPVAALAEVRRLLKPGGVFIFHTTNAKHFLTPLSSLFPKRLKNKIIAFLEGRQPADIFPTYYRINTLKKIGQLAEAANLDVVELSSVNSTPETFMLGPLVVFELMATRLLSAHRMRGFRSNLVAVLRRPA